MSNCEVIIGRLNDYSPEDAADLGILRNHMSPWRADTPLPERMIRDFTDYPEQRVFAVARLATSGRIVSAETLNLLASPDVGESEIGRSAIMGFVSTHRDYRNLGIFAKVWVEGLGWCEENEVSTINLWSSDNPHRQDARRFYRNHGAEYVETEHFKVVVKVALEQERQKLAVHQ